jgi:hypothetical protein
MSFVAITVCIASQWVFIVLHVKYDQQFSNGGFEETVPLH